MEIQQLRDMDYQSDGPEMQRVWDLMFCRDPLTLEKAVEVMGREPDKKSHDTVFVWDAEDIHFVIGGLVHGSMVPCYVVVKQNRWYLPKVGQFACLVLAAKMGEQA